MAQRSGFQFHAAAMEKQSLTQGQGHKEMLRRVAAHRHGEDCNADIDTEPHRALVQDGRVVCEDSVGMLAASTDGRVREPSGGDERKRGGQGDCPTWGWRTRRSRQNSLKRVMG